MRCRNVLHLWFPTYDEELGKYSPGNIYFVEQAAAAEQLGIRRIDLGGGNERFKASLRSLARRSPQGPWEGGGCRVPCSARGCILDFGCSRSRFRKTARAVVRGLRGLFLVWTTP